MKRTIAVAVVSLFALAACGGGDKSDDDVVDAMNNAPKCSDVWVDGGTIPEGYEGCLSDDGETFEAGVSTECADGTEVFTYEPNGDGFYSKPDGTIVQAGADYANDPDYAAVYDACAG